jgi:sulfur carrier protein
MKLSVNGEWRTLPEDGVALAAFLEGEGVDATKGIAVAVNDRVAPRSKWNDVRLTDGDRVEIVTARQGG